jgi:hypothetical protein
MVGPADQHPDRMSSKQSIYPIASIDATSGGGVPFLFQLQQLTQVIRVIISSEVSWQSARVFGSAGSRI